MDYDLGYFDLETRVLEPLENPFGAKVLLMSPGRTPNQNGAPKGTILELFSLSLINSPVVRAEQVRNDIRRDAESD